MNKNIRRLVVTAMLLALATALSMIKIYQLPLGGSITLLSMLPVAMISIQYGMKWGFASSFLYSLIQAGLGISAVLTWGLTPLVVVACILFDYIFAFTAIGFSGLFRKKGIVGICAGITIALVLRFASHLFSGVVLFSAWMPETFTSPLLYSIVYNGSYMLPEIIFTAVGASLLFKQKQIIKLMAGDVESN